MELPHVPVVELRFYDKKVLHKIKEIMQLLVFAVIMHCAATIQAYSCHSRSEIALIRPLKRSFTRLSAKVARDEKVTIGESELEPDLDRTVTIPYNGVLGVDPSSLFAEPLDIFDPMKDTDSLPGEDGSDEKIAAIMQRIETRVSELKESGEWTDDKEFGEDPLVSVTSLAVFHSCCC